MRRPVHLFLFLFTLVGVILLLRWQYPDAVAGSGRWLDVLYGVMWLALIGTSWRIRRLDSRVQVKYAAIWLAIIVGLMLFYDLLKRFA